MTRCCVCHIVLDMDYNSGLPEMCSRGCEAIQNILNEPLTAQARAVLFRLIANLRRHNRNYVLEAQEIFEPIEYIRDRREEQQEALIAENYHNMRIIPEEYYINLPPNRFDPQEELDINDPHERAVQQNPPPTFQPEDYPQATDEMFTWANTTVPINRYTATANTDPGDTL